MRSPLAMSWTAAALSAAVVIATPVHMSGAEEPVGKRHVVEIRELAFVPDRLVAAPGDTVVWINRDIVSHTATAEDESWDSGEIEAGGRWQMVVTADTGLAYFCLFHPAMKGRLTISER